ncbi:MAG: double-strand break repair protein AddB [Proteobacteria bacterium]|nr:double-strand break repair protein AddB [Pseudomonadota bacterium]
MAPPKIYSIAAGLPFVDVLAAGIRDRVGDAPLALAEALVLVPTKRARRSLSEAFLRQSGGRALLLPRMIALGEMDEDGILFSGGLIADGGGDHDLSVPEAMSGLHRQLILTRMVMARDAGTSPDQAANLGLELARLLDQVHTERLAFDGLKNLVPDEFAEHWQETLEFLTVLTDAWPKVLEEEAAIDAADRRNRLLDAQGRAWTLNPPAGPVIAAGSTGSIPATADLLAVVAGLEHGAVVLAGLDFDTGADAWASLEEHHPQFGMARLLAHLGAAREDVGQWHAPGFAAEQSPRARLIHAALTPAGTEDALLPGKKAMKKALDGIARIDCPTPREEAAVIALVMRHTLKTPSRTCALVTPDRGLARRVAAELARWDVDVDDSAGLPLAQTLPGAFLMLTARMAADDLAPVSLLAALKHPLAAGGMAPAAFRKLTRTLEVAVLRGPRPAPGFNGLRAAAKVAKKSGPALNEFLDQLQTLFEPFTKVMARGGDGVAGSLTDFLTAHIHLAEALAAKDTADGAPRLWAGDAGEAAANFIAELKDAGATLAAITANDYPALLETLMAGRMVRPRFGRHPRLHIWGLLEARLQQADVMILGGLNDDTWPPEAKANPWMSRPMLRKFGLPAPERRIGLAAHDFAQAFAAANVVLTRSERVDGTPQMASRWLLRLDSVLEKNGMETGFASAQPWLAWVHALDRPPSSRAVSEPRPTPPLDVRPRQLSVTQVEHWIRDPYAIYARHILKLKPLPPIDAEPGAADRGIIIHGVLHQFLERTRGALPADAEKLLLEIGRDVFNQSQVPPGVEAFWWPRFERIAAWFIGYEKARRAAGFQNLAGEINGGINLMGPAGPFTLTARADRIDHRADIGLAVIDYKTGPPPSAPQVIAGFSPQLPLEAAIAEAGGFENLTADGVAQLVYLSLSGGKKPGEEKVLKLDVAETIDDALKGLGDLIAQYDDPKMPYLSQPRPMLLEYAGDYDHLARVLEWRGRLGDGA